MLQIYLHDIYCNDTQYIHTNTIHLHNTQHRFQANYEAALASGSEGRSASIKAVSDTWGHVTRLGMHEDAPRHPRPRRPDPHTERLEQELGMLHEERGRDRQRMELDR